MAQRYRPGLFAIAKEEEEWRLHLQARSDRQRGRDRSDCIRRLGWSLATRQRECQDGERDAVSAHGLPSGPIDGNGASHGERTTRNSGADGKRPNGRPCFNPAPYPINANKAAIAPAVTK